MTKCLKAFPNPFELRVRARRFANYSRTIGCTELPEVEELTRSAAFVSLPGTNSNSQRSSASCPLLFLCAYSLPAFRNNAFSMRFALSMTRLYSSEDKRPRREHPEVRRSHDRNFLDVYFGLMTITESVRPLPSSSVAELVGSFRPIPSTRNL